MNSKPNILWCWLILSFVCWIGDCLSQLEVNFLTETFNVSNCSELQVISKNKAYCETINDTITTLVISGNNYFANYIPTQVVSFCHCNKQSHRQCFFPNPKKKGRDRRDIFGPLFCDAN